MTALPILILLATPTDAGQRQILGLSLIQRAEMAGRRAGYQVVRLGRVDGAYSWGAIAPAGMLTVIAPAAVLIETDWLAKVAQAPIARGVWADAPGRVVVLAPATASLALAALAENASANDIASVEERLTARFGPPASLPAGVDPMLVTRLADVPAAERRLMGGLVKDTDGFMARYVERPISLAISRRLAPTRITPNQMSLISIAVGLCGGPFFLSSRPLMQTIGALFFLAHSILDGCDGELARLKFQESRWGGVLDFWGDNIVHVVIFACMSIGWSLSARAAWPLLFGAGAVLGTLGSAGFVYWRLMRAKEGSGALFTSVSAAPEGAMAQVLDAASRRDFIYLVLLLALFGWSNAFVVLSGLGAPIYLVFVLILAAQDRGSLARPSSA